MVNYHDAISELKHFIHSDSLTEAPSNDTCLLAKEKREDWRAIWLS